MSATHEASRRKAKVHKSKRVNVRMLEQSCKKGAAPSLVMSPLIHKPKDDKEQDEARKQAKAAKRQKEDRLWSNFKSTGSQDARNELWVYYQSLVRYIADRLKSKLPESVDVFDLIGAGNVGLQDAISKFDPQIGVRFETYCVPRIRGAILDSIRAYDWVPRMIRNKSHQFDRVVKELSIELGREPLDDEIAARLGIDWDQLQRLRRELDVKAQISIEGANAENTDERDMLRLEMLADRERIEPTRELQRLEIQEVALRGLQPSERAVVEQYYFNGLSMKQIGKELNLSESRICQIHAQVLEMLRKKFRAYEQSCDFS